ncbi:Na+/H+ antiporter subunit E [Georgenia satyanarayanai]|uniref:Na+/H+ antiporter subunit E n=1 Tax=Georgenia satyanarayanai TaxID=860221 RepID=UPI00203E45A6|nr:Na+/H+ antiporter subunit E [Georgenia satyanarayanai]MCM3660425.1 Na+/H+ antiporter subunit E [Georgenia satyanarayanai]
MSPHIADHQPQEHRPRGRFRPRANWGILLWLTLVWVALWGDLSLANVVIGAFLAVLVTAVLPLPSTPFDGRFRPWGVVLLLGYFLWDVIKASVEVAALAVRREPPHGAVIRVRLRSHNDVYLTMVAGMTSLVPGSVVIEAHRITGTLYHHILDVDMHGGLERAHQAVLDQEERILRAFGSREELIEAGLTPGSSARAGKQRSRSGDRVDRDMDARREEGS